LSSPTTHPGTLAGGSVLGHAVFGLDRWLRRRQGIYEYSNDPVCLFRVNQAEADEAVTLSDGTHIHPGNPILELHLWNEHIPLMPTEGATLAWACRLHQAVDMSLRELACWMARQPDLDQVIALRGDMRIGTAGRGRQFTRIAARYGFESGAWRAGSGSLRQFGENILLCFLVMAANPVAIRSDVLWRGHTLVYLARRVLERHYGVARHR
jgi:hypothetical protein